ncbi:Rv1733c family protein [Streptomyces griseosporeus]|uniref:Rv1733c family protein n=1 Tax=Streptomyces griseosporeus TaxID=1910 RepID=UPI0036874381
MALRGPKVWLWRWRRNPLRRRADRVEAWVVLAAWAVTVLAGVLAGLVTARTVEQGLAQERAEWRPAAAHLTESAPGRAADRPEDAGERVWAEVAWTAPDGSPRSGQVRVSPGTGAGTAVTVWTDHRGRLVSPPASASQAELRSTLIGGLGGLSAAAVPFAAGRALRRRLEERRLDLWDLAWARFDPLWRGRTG